MPIRKENLIALTNIAKDYGATLIAVSKTQPIEDIEEAYALGVRDFGENKVQELCQKQEALPKDIRWHMIGHLQSNKVKNIVPFVHLIHSVDSLKLLEEIEKQATKVDRICDVLLEVYIATEESKFGWDAQELLALFNNKAFSNFKNIRLRGLMGMASFTDNQAQISNEMRGLAALFQEIKMNVMHDNASFDTLSMGMSGDYEIALKEGSNMIRVGSKIFGERKYHE